MVMKAFGKTTFRLFKKHLVRLITIIAIVTVSIGVVSGIGEVENRIKLTITDYYKEQNVSDFIIKSKRGAFSAEELEKISQKFSTDKLLFSFGYELDTDGEITRVCSLNLNEADINKPKLLSGRFPQSESEIAVERATDKLKSYEIGETVTLNGVSYTVCGSVLSPLYINKIEEPSFVFESRNLSYVVYSLPSAIQPVNDVYVALTDRTEFRALSKSYKNLTARVKSELETELHTENVSVLSLFENAGIFSLISYAEKVQLIGIVFVVFFLLVTMLVVYSNMSRLLDEERGQIACMKTLGYTNFAITNRYSLFVLAGTLIGGLIALPIGLGVTYVIYAAFNMQYAMPPFPGISALVYYVFTLTAIILSTLLLTFFTGLKIVRNKPVELLKHKAPMPGKKVIVERIGFIWNKLSFKYKSTLRNVLLFKSRFFMTVISVIGSTVLVFAGLGLLDCSATMPNATSILAIAVILIIFSALLCALVIYNLTNINISERNREIATLMVLGYRDREITGYIFREIYIMSFIGAILGIPFGYGFMQFVFNLINFGSIAEINWWTWLLAPAVTMFFAFISTLMLRRKIIKTDMNSSLKTLE